MSKPRPGKRSSRELIEHRRHQKQLSRGADALALSSSAKSIDELRCENGHFARLNVKVEFDKARSLSGDGARSVADYVREKELAKRKDEDDLRSGAKSPAELKKENEHFSGLRARIDFRRVKSPK